MLSLPMKTGSFLVFLPPALVRKNFMLGRASMRMSRVANEVRFSKKLTTLSCVRDRVPWIQSIMPNII